MNNDDFREKNEFNQSGLERRERQKTKVGKKETGEKRISGEKYGKDVKKKTGKN